MKNHKGFGLFGVIVAIGVVGAVGFTGWYIWSKQEHSDNSEPQTTLQESPQTAEPLVDPKAAARDQERKNDITKFMVQVAAFAANNNGRFPSTEPTKFRDDFLEKYLQEKSEDVVDPSSGQAYEFTPVAKVQTAPDITTGVIQYQWPGVCVGSEFGDNATNRQAAARIQLESGEIYCVDT